MLAALPEDVREDRSPFPLLQVLHLERDDYRSRAVNPVQDSFLYSMRMEASYTEARQNLARLLDRVVEDRDVVYIRRGSRQRVALVAADELAGLLETAHLLRSPRNVTRLLAALQRALKKTGRPKDAAQLRDNLGFGR